MIQERLVAILADAAERAAPELGLEQSDLQAPELSRPNVREHGDWATNLALVLAGRAKRPPLGVAASPARRAPAPGSSPSRRARARSAWRAPAPGGPIARGRARARRVQPRRRGWRRAAPGSSDQSTGG